MIPFRKTAARGKTCEAEDEITILESKNTPGNNRDLLFEGAYNRYSLLKVLSYSINHVNSSSNEIIKL